MDHTTSRVRRGRLLVAALGLGLVASTVSVVALASPAAAIPPGGYCGYAAYYNIVDHGRVHTRTEPTQMVQNGNPAAINVSFTSQKSGTVTSSATSTTTFSGGINLGIVNTSVSNTLSITVTHSATSTIGITVGPMSLPAGMTQFGDYGVFRQWTSGDYWNEFWCDIYQSGQINAYSVIGVGWKVWQA